MPAPARAIPHPVLSSPRRLAFLGLGVTLITYAIQLASGVPAWLSWSPVELSSNVVAMMGLAWTALQVRASWADRELRGVWLAASAGMALLSIEDHVGDLFTMETHAQDEMSLSVVIWLIAACLIFRIGRRYAMRRSVSAALWLSFAIQIVAQAIGLLAASDILSEDASNFLDYVNDSGELFAVLGYLGALLLAVFSADKTYDFPLSAIGRKGREIFRDFRLEQPGGSLGLPVLREIATLFSIGVFWGRASAAVHRDGGPTRARQLAGLFRCAFLSRVDPKSYYLFELFHAERPGRAADAVTTRAETSAGLTASIQRTIGFGAAAFPLFDRLAFTRACEAHRLPAAPILATVEHGAWAPLPNDGVTLDRSLEVRPRDARRGDVALTLTRIAPSLFRDDDGVLLNVEMVVARLSAMSRDGALVVSPKLANHETIACYARASTLLFRVVTCLDEAGRPHVTHGVMRIRHEREPEWPAAPGREWGAAIDLQSGLFGAVASDAAENCTDWRYAHPVTREMIAGRKCAGWSEIARAAREAHARFDDHVVIGWDIAWTPDGPVIVEADADPDFAFLQRCYGAPLGQSPLGPLLDAHLDRVVALRS